MFDQLSDKLETTFKKLRGHGKLTEANIKEATREIKLSLLEADVNFRVVKEFINRVKLIDSFIYMKVSEGRVSSVVYLPQRDAVKSHSVDVSEIFQISEWPDTDKEMKIAFFEGSKVIDAIKHFDHDAIKGELEFLETETEFVASTLRIFNDELEITLSCSEPSLGFKDLTEDQQAAIFATDDTKFSFTMDTHTINKVKNLFGLDKDETFSVKANGTGVAVSGKSLFQRGFFPTF